MGKGASMYNIAEDILFGEKLSHPYHPVIKNQKLAVEVAITVRDKFNNITGQYGTIIEQGCRNCEFGALETNVEPCVTCYKRHTPEHPYKMWQFDETYDPRDDFMY